MVERESYKERMRAGGCPRPNTPGSSAPKIIPEQHQEVKHKFMYFFLIFSNPILCNLSIDWKRVRVYNKDTKKERGIKK